MESISKTLDSKEVQEAISLSGQDRFTNKCWRCSDTGVVLVNGFARNCICLRRKLNKARLAVIPPVFNNPRLGRLKPHPDLHPKQAGIIQLIQSYPNDSYVLTGKNGTGKTHFAWAIFRHALSQHRPAIACTVRDLLSEYRRVEIGVPDGETLKSPRVSAEELRKIGRPWLLLLDEFEKARPTEFASEQLFNLLDAAKSFNHQIVITSNLNWDGLRAHWSRIDEIWGNSILTRLSHCRVVEMF